VYFERKIQLSEFFAYLDVPPSQLIRISGIFTALECGIDAEAGEDDSPLVGFYKHRTESKISIIGCEFFIHEKDSYVLKEDSAPWKRFVRLSPKLCTQQ